MIHPCDRRTDGETDGRAIAFIRAIAYMLPRVKTMRSHTSNMLYSHNLQSVLANNSNYRRCAVAEKSRDASHT